MTSVERLVAATKYLATAKARAAPVLARLEREMESEDGDWRHFSRIAGESRRVSKNLQRAFSRADSAAFRLMREMGLPLTSMNLIHARLRRAFPGATTLDVAPGCAIGTPARQRDPRNWIG